MARSHIFSLPDILTMRVMPSTLVTSLLEILISVSKTQMIKKYSNIVILTPEKTYTD